MTVIDLTQDKIENIIDVGAMPTYVVIPPGGKYAYVSDQGGSAIIIIDLAANIVSGAIQVASNPITIVCE